MRKILKFHLDEQRLRCLLLLEDRIRASFRKFDVRVTTDNSQHRYNHIGRFPWHLPVACRLGKASIYSFSVRLVLVAEFSN
jgi:hypothetical protein